MARQKEEYDWTAIEKINARKLENRKAGIEEPKIVACDCPKDNSLIAYDMRFNCYKNCTRRQNQ